MTIHADIVIVGAGLVGSALACTLAQTNKKLSILVVEASDETVSVESDRFDPRVVALNIASIDLMQTLGVWQSVAHRACPYQRMKVWDGEGNGSIAFRCEDVHVRSLGSIVENSVMLQALRSRMREYASIQFLSPAEVTALQFNGDTSEIMLNGDQLITANFVVGADGARSVLRDLAGIRTKEWDYGHSAIVTTVRNQHGHQNTAWQRFSHQGPLAFLPLQSLDGSEASSGRFCSIVWSLEEGYAAEMMSLNGADFCRKLALTFEHTLGDVEWADQRFCIPLRQRRALSYGLPGFALIGDAAHTIHPLAGQGVNLGLADVKSLSAELSRAHARSVPLSDPSVIKRYQRSRKPHNIATMAAMEGFKQLFGSDYLLAQTLRNRGLDWVDGRVWLKNLLIHGASF